MRWGKERQVRRKMMEKTLFVKQRLCSGSSSLVVSFRER